MKYVDYVVDQINIIQKRYTYRNVFKDWLTMVANWHEGKHQFIEDGDTFDDTFEGFC